MELRYLHRIRVFTDYRQDLKRSRSAQGAKLNSAANDSSNILTLFLSNKGWVIHAAIYNSNVLRSVDEQMFSLTVFFMTRSCDMIVTNSCILSTIVLETLMRVLSDECKLEYVRQACNVSVWSSGCALANTTPCSLTAAWYWRVSCWCCISARLSWLV